MGRRDEAIAALAVARQLREPLTVAEATRFLGQHVGEAIAQVWQ